MTIAPEAPYHRILVVEDDTELALMVADFLSPHGFDVEIETRGDTAVDRIKEENPDAVVLDINLPGLDGFAVCHAVRDDYDGAIVMLTARGEEIDLRRLYGKTCASTRPARAVADSSATGDSGRTSEQTD